jgi:predicted O-linked N-acetylglucosamine transferase (SPINDLY family)
MAEVPRAAYLAAYAEVDMILDTFPFTGGTTTCEALWMGVPTLTLTGNTLLARQGVSLLSAVGLHDWIAADEQMYVDKAISYAQQLPALAQLRTQLRSMLQRSPLVDAPRFARHFSYALQSMWREKMGI